LPINELPIAGAFVGAAVATGALVAGMAVAATGALVAGIEVATPGIWVAAAGSCVGAVGVAGAQADTTPAVVAIAQVAKNSRRDIFLPVCLYDMNLSLNLMLNRNQFNSQVDRHFYNNELFL
jgi:hypothetical protein